MDIKQLRAEADECRRLMTEIDDQLVPLVAKALRELAVRCDGVADGLEQMRGKKRNLLAAQRKPHSQYHRAIINIERARR